MTAEVETAEVKHLPEIQKGKGYDTGISKQWSLLRNCRGEDNSVQCGSPRKNCSGGK
jgi:hypothetical protein